MNFPLSRTFLLVSWEFGIADAHCICFLGNFRTAFSQKTSWLNLLNLNLKKCNKEQSKEITTKNEKVVPFTCAIHFTFSPRHHLKPYHMRIIWVLPSYESTSFTVTMHVFHSNNSCLKLLLLLWMTLIWKEQQTKIFDQWFNLLQWISKEISGVRFLWTKYFRKETAKLLKKNSAKVFNI